MANTKQHSFGAEKTCNMYEVAAWTLHVCKLLHCFFRVVRIWQGHSKLLCDALGREAIHATILEMFEPCLNISCILLLSQLSCLGIEFQTTIERQAVAVG